MHGPPPARRPRRGGAPRRASGPTSGPGGRRTGQQPRRGPTEGRSSGARSGARSGRPGKGRPERAKPERPRTTAEQRAAEVRARRGLRPPRDREAHERARLEARTVEIWEQAGDDLRDEAERATGRAAAPSPQRGGHAKRSKGRRDAAAVEQGIAAQIRAAAPDRRTAEQTIARLADAQDALDRERLNDARQLIAPIVKGFPGVAAVRELAGLVGYGLGHWRVAVRELEAAQALEANIELLPALADAYRAQKRWKQVDRIWGEVRAASPAHAVMAEARIVAAGAQADRGDLPGALDTMNAAMATPKRVRDHHLRQWYVLGDLHDRAGNAIEARRWFDRVAQHDRQFADVAERLRSLGGR